jgi:hypothetical protein
MKKLFTSITLIGLSLPLLAQNITADTTRYNAIIHVQQSAYDLIVKSNAPINEAAPVLNNLQGIIAYFKNQKEQAVIADKKSKLSGGKKP